MQVSRDYRFNFFIYLKHPFEQNNRIFQLRRTFDGERMKNEFPMKINFIVRPEIVAFDSFRKRLHPV